MTDNVSNGGPHLIYMEEHIERFAMFKEQQFSGFPLGKKCQRQQH